MLGILPGILALLLPMVSVKSETMASTSCVDDNSTTIGNIYQFSEKELNATKLTRLSKFNGKVYS